MKVQQSTKFFRFPAPAKLNLFLHITAQRTDGYHELQSIFQFLDYGDTLEIAINHHGTINLLTPIEGVLAEDNLIVKAAKALQRHSRTRLGAEIKINKILPMGGGLGGGSSNAATVLLALNTLWETKLSTKALAEIGLKLGADVPIFIHGHAAFAEGVGEILTFIEPKEYWYLISKPTCSISTAEVFSSPELARNTEKITLTMLDLEYVMEQCHNDCQAVVIKNYPEVAKLLAWLVEYAPSQMTGTGACIFSRFDSEDEARLIQSQLPKEIGSFVAKGLNKSSIFAALNKANT